MAADSPLSVCPWPGDKRWVYSITFDEALAELHRFVVPILARYGVPGHLECVVGHLGKVRRIGQSSFNGFRHMGPAELREMLARGWGVGNHTWSHELIKPEMVEREIGEAKRVLEDAVGEPVTVYCAANDNSNMSAHVLDACRRHGYVGAMSITDALNPSPLPGSSNDLLWLNRTFLHTQGYAPFYSEFDPFRQLAHARRDAGWVIDYLHCPMEKAVHPNKDCSAAELEERIATVLSEGGDDVWLARVEDALDYRYTRRAARIQEAGDGTWTVSAPELHPAVTRRRVTLRVPADAAEVRIDQERATPVQRSGKLLVDVDLSQPRTIEVSASPSPQFRGSP